MKQSDGKFLSTVQVGDDGQIVLPEEVLKMFALKPGDSMMVLADKNKGIAIRRKIL